MAEILSRAGTTQSGDCQSSGHASSPAREHDTHVAFLYALNDLLTEAGDEGIAGTSKRRGVASTLAPTESFRWGRGFR